MEKDIPIGYLRECFSYDLESGFLTWLPRPRERFKTSQSHGTWNARYAGREAGAAHSGGYRTVTLSFGGSKHRLLGHRIVFALVNGEWPKRERSTTSMGVVATIGL